MIKIYEIRRVLNHPYIKAVKSTFTRIRCAHITWNVLGETSLFLDQRLGPNDFTNRGPRILPTANLGGLIEDVRQNKFLDSVTMPSQVPVWDKGFDQDTLLFSTIGVTVSIPKF